MNLAIRTAMVQQIFGFCSSLRPRQFCCRVLTSNQIGHPLPRSGAFLELIVESRPVPLE
jgi:hypothetical protein